MYTSIIASQLIAIIALIVACFAITGHISYRNKVGITRHVDLNLEYNETTNRYEGEFTLEANEYLDHFYIVTGEHNGPIEFNVGYSSNSTELHGSNKILQKNSSQKLYGKESQPQSKRKSVHLIVNPQIPFFKERRPLECRIMGSRQGPSKRKTRKMQK